MNNSEMDPKIAELIQELEKKYDVMGQDLSSYLNGLLYADYLTYWDYIHLDTLLSLQTPKTPLPDEHIFIIYHQITELYFKLIIHEQDQLRSTPDISADFLLKRLGRINRYFEHLEHSFTVMVDGMDKDQFLKYRMSLLPASGFQSGQFRMIEMASTDLINLVHLDSRSKVTSMSSIEDLYEVIYWKSGATELSTGKKTLTLKQFEEKYYKSFIELLEKAKGNNLWQLYLSVEADDNIREKLKNELQKLDVLANISWPLAHYKSAVRYLQKDPEDIAATGGTNWQKYLPPRFQKVMYYPELWTDEEQNNWGKTWVIKEVFDQ